jgi:hypothetical protein
MIWQADTTSALMYSSENVATWTGNWSFHTCSGPSRFKRLNQYAGREIIVCSDCRSRWSRTVLWGRRAFGAWKRDEPSNG